MTREIVCQGKHLQQCDLGQKVKAVQRKRIGGKLLTLNASYRKILYP